MSTRITSRNRLLLRVLVGLALGISVMLLSRTRAGVTQEAGHDSGGYLHGPSPEPRRAVALAHRPGQPLRRLGADGEESSADRDPEVDEDGSVMGYSRAQLEEAGITRKALYGQHVFQHMMLLAAAISAVPELEFDQERMHETFRGMMNAGSATGLTDRQAVRAMLPIEQAFVDEVRSQLAGHMDVVTTHGHSIRDIFGYLDESLDGLADSGGPSMERQIIRQENDFLASGPEARSKDPLAEGAESKPGATVGNEGARDRGRRGLEEPMRRRFDAAPVELPMAGAPAPEVRSSGPP